MTEEAKHTPAPWKDIYAEDYQGFSWIEIARERNNPNLINPCDFKDRATDADILLMTAAPELLVAAKAAEELIRNFEQSNSLTVDLTLKALIDAINKAKGEANNENQ